MMKYDWDGRAQTIFSLAPLERAPLPQTFVVTPPSRGPPYHKTFVVPAELCVGKLLRAGRIARQGEDPAEPLNRPQLVAQHVSGHALSVDGSHLQDERPELGGSLSGTLGSPQAVVVAGFVVKVVRL